MGSMGRMSCWHTVRASKLVIRMSLGARLHPHGVDFHPTRMWRCTCSWIDWPSGGPFQYNTLISTRRITHSGTECNHITEYAPLANDFKILLLLASPLKLVHFFHFFK